MVAFLKSLRKLPVAEEVKDIAIFINRELVPFLIELKDSIVATVGDFDFEDIPTDSLVGRDSSGTGPVESITLDDTLEFTGSQVIQRAGITGDAIIPAGSNVSTIPALPGINAEIDALADPEYIVGALASNLNNERLASNSTKINVDLTTPGVASWDVNPGTVELSDIEDVAGPTLIGRQTGTGPAEALTGGESGHLIKKPNVITAAITTNQNDWSPTGLSGTDTIFADAGATSGNITLTGIDSSVFEELPGTMLRIVFNGASAKLTLSAGNGLSLAENRFLSVGSFPIILENRQKATLLYCTLSGLSGWLILPNSPLLDGATMGNRIRKSSTINATIAGSTHNWSPAGLVDAHAAYVTLTGSQTITGIDSTVFQAGGNLAVGRELLIGNIDTVDTLTFSAGNPSSLIGNRFSNLNSGTIVYLPPGHAVLARREAPETTGTWRLIELGGLVPIRSIMGNPDGTFVSSLRPITSSAARQALMVNSANTALGWRAIEAADLPAVATPDWADVLAADPSSGTNNPVIESGQHIRFGAIDGTLTGQMRSSVSPFRTSTSGSLQFFVGTSGFFSFGSEIEIQATGYAALRSGVASITLSTNSVDRLIISNDGEWEVEGDGGAAGEVLTSQGPGVPPAWTAAAGAGGLLAYTEYTLADGSGTHVWQSGTRRVIHEIHAGGGGAGGVSGASGQARHSSGGGAGGSNWGHTVTSATPTGGSYSVGAGGSGGLGSTPVDGGDGENTFLVVNGVGFTAIGGSGSLGVATNANPNSSSGAGGTSNSDREREGQAGRRSWAVSSTAGPAFGGQGGSSTLGTGGFGAISFTDHQDGLDGVGPGAGGGGAAVVNTVNDGAGGDGGDGLIRIWEYSGSSEEEPEPDPVAFVSVETGDDSFTATVPSGDNRLLVAVVYSSTETSDRTATYGGTGMTAAITTNDWVQIFYMLDPPVGAATLAVTGGSVAFMNATHYTGVDSFQAASAQEGQAASASFSPSDAAVVVFGLSSEITGHTPLADTNERYDAASNEWQGDRIVTGSGSVNVGANTATNPDYAGCIFLSV